MFQQHTSPSTMSPEAGITASSHLREQLFARTHAAGCRISAEVACMVIRVLCRIPMKSMTRYLAGGRVLHAECVMHIGNTACTDAGADVQL